MVDNVNENYWGKKSSILVFKNSENLIHKKTMRVRINSLKAAD